MDEILSKWTFLALHLCMMTQEKRDKQGGIKFSSFQMKAKIGTMAFNEYLGPFG